MRTHSLLLHTLLGAALACMLAACGDDGGGAADGSVTGGPDGGGVPDGPVGPGADADVPDWPTNDGGQPLCEDKDLGLVVCACVDGMDNDGDGSADAADPECSGPFDNDEGSFATGIPGDNSDPFAQDCFFDGDSGGGNDGCRWDIRCMDTMAPYEGQHCNNNSTVGCDNCLVLTPNGCDCFGCCDVYVDGTPHRVRIQEGCTTAVITDTALCPPCDFVVDCLNPCDVCEECVGRPDPDPSCMPADGGVVGCADGEVACDPVDNSCPAGFSCVTGCCKPIIP